METKKKKKNPVIVILIILFIIYASLYMSQATGYYEVKNHQKQVMTKEAMKKFENDVENGKDISIDNYLTETKVNYSSKVGNLGNKASSLLENAMKKGIKSSFGILNKLLS